MNIDTLIPVTIGWVLAIVVAVFVIVVLFRSIRIIPQARAGVVERLGKYHKTLSPGLNLVVPSSTACGRCSTCASRSSRSRRSR